jgi:hypothetical protein
MAAIQENETEDEPLPSPRQRLLAPSIITAASNPRQPLTLTAGHRSRMLLLLRPFEALAREGSDGNDSSNSPRLASPP